MASSSDDNSVKIWDLATATCVLSHSVPNVIVENIRWDPQNESLLFTAGDDNTFRVSDIRTSKEVGSYQFPNKIESFTVNPLNSNEYHLCFDNGFIGGIDLKGGFKPSYELQISSESVTSISFHHKIPGLVCATALDGAFRVYNTTKRVQDNKPTFVVREVTQQGKLFAGSFYEDHECLFACGGGKGELVIWSMEDNKEIIEAFSLKK